ncbi:MAG: EamA family transporter [Rhodothermia bacterium]|nr:MAG: EamA family transporter [Rhodothermia bacterium]
MYIDFPSFAPPLEMPLDQPFLIRWKSEAQLLFVVLVWGSNFVVIKLVLDVMNPHVMNVFRILSAGLFLAYAHHKRQRSRGQSFFEPIKQFPFELIRIGLIGWVVYQVAFIVGIDYTTAGSAALIMASLPLWTALLSAVLLKERLNKIMWMGLILSISGVFVVVLSGNQTVDLGSEYVLGNLIVLLAALLWGLNTVYTKSLVDQVTPVGITMLGLLVSIPFLAAISIPFWDSMDWSRVNWYIWVAILFSGGISTGIAVALWNSAVKIMGPSHTAAFQNLVPVVALITALIVLDEAILLAQIVGGSLTIGGLIVMHRARNRERTQLSDAH